MIRQYMYWYYCSELYFLDVHEHSRMALNVYESSWIILIGFDSILFKIYPINSKILIFEFWINLILKSSENFSEKDDLIYNLILT